MALDVRLCLVSQFLTPRDVDNLNQACRHSREDCIELLKASLIGRNGLSEADKHEIRNITCYPPRLSVGLHLRMFEGEKLSRIIRANQLLDPRTKVRLLMHNDHDLYRWFIHTFVVNKPKVKRSELIGAIHQIASTYEGGMYHMNDTYLVLAMNCGSIRVYNKKTNMVVAFATPDGLIQYIDDRSVDYLTSSFVFTVNFSYTKYGDDRLVA